MGAVKKKGKKGGGKKKKKKKKKEEVRAMRGRAHMCHDAKCAISELMSHPRVKANQIAMTLC